MVGITISLCRAEDTAAVIPIKVMLNPPIYEKPERPDPRGINALMTMLGGQLPPWGLSSDGEVCVACAADRRLSVWNTRTGQRLTTLPIEIPKWDDQSYGLIRAVAAGSRDSNGHRIIAADGPSATSSLNMSMVLKTMNEGGSNAFELSTDANKTGRAHVGIGPQELAYSGDGFIVIVDLQQHPPKTIRLNGMPFGMHGSFGTSEVEPLVFSPDGRYLAGGLANTNIAIFDATEGHEVRRLQFEGLKGSMFDSAIRTIDYSPSGKLIAGGPNSWVEVFSSNSGASLRKLRNATACKFLTDDLMLVVKENNDSEKATVSVVDLRTEDDGVRLFELDEEILQMAVDSGGNLIIITTNATLAGKPIYYLQTY